MKLFDFALFCGFFCLARLLYYIMQPTKQRGEAMTHQKASNGVTVAQKDLAKFARENNVSLYNIDKFSGWADFKKTNNLKITKSDFVELLKAELERQKAISTQRYDNRKLDKYRGNENHYLRAYDRKQKSLRHFDERSISLSEALNKSYKASWDESYTIVRLEDNLFLSVLWDTESDWDYYSKSYGRPKNTYSNRRVELFRADAFGFSENLKEYPLEHFRGQFLIDAMVDFFNLKKQKVAKHLKKVQLNDYMSISLLRKIGNTEIYERRLGKYFVDYCIVSNRQTYHSDKFSELVPGLRRKLQIHKNRENEILTAKVGFELGFCGPGIRSFCEDNNLDFDGEYTRKELREIVVKNREINCKKYQAELRKIGINLKCKSN